MKIEQLRADLITQSQKFKEYVDEISRNHRNWISRFETYVYPAISKRSKDNSTKNAPKYLVVVIKNSEWCLRRGYVPKEYGYLTTEKLRSAVVDLLVKEQGLVYHGHNLE